MAEGERALLVKYVNEWQGAVISVRPSDHPPQRHRPPCAQLATKPSQSSMRSGVPGPGRRSFPLGMSPPSSRQLPHPKLVDSEDIARSTHVALGMNLAKSKSEDGISALGPVETRPIPFVSQCTDPRRAFLGDFRKLPRSRMVQSILSLQPRLPPRPHSRRLRRTHDLACDGTEGIPETFTGCLTVPPNFHALEVIYMSARYLRPLYKALNGIKHPQTRTRFLPSVAHHILRHCPNVDDLTCIPFQLDQEFVESLAVGQQKLRRFSALFPANPIISANEGRSEYSGCVINGSPSRTGSDLPCYR